MELACMTFSIPAESFDQCLAITQEMGFRSIDLASKYCIDPIVATRAPHQEAKTIRRKVDEYGLKISEVFLLRFEDWINSPDAAKRSRTRDLFEKYSLFCSEVGAKSIMMSPGPIHDQIGMQESFNLAVEELRFEQEVCQQRDLRLNIEPHWHSLAESPEMARQFCEEVPGLGLTLDYSHFVAQGYTQDEIEPLHRYATHFHARQARTGHTNTSKSEGVIDFTRIIQKLERDRWDGTICVEYNPQLIENPEREVCQLKASLEDLLRTQEV